MNFWQPLKCWLDMAFASEDLDARGPPGSCHLQRVDCGLHPEEADALHPAGDPEPKWADREPWEAGLEQGPVLQTLCDLLVRGGEEAG